MGSKTIILTSLSSSSRVNSFFLTCLSWLRKLNSAAFFWSLANLFSYLETFFSVGFMLIAVKQYYYSFDKSFDPLSVFQRLNSKIYHFNKKKGYLQFTSKVVHLAVQVRDLQRSKFALVSRVSTLNLTNIMRVLRRIFTAKELGIYRNDPRWKHPITIHIEKNFLNLGKTVEPFLTTFLIFIGFP